MKTILFRATVTLVIFSLLGSLVIFGMLQLLRGDAILLMLDDLGSLEAVEERRRALGLNRPWPPRYLDWLTGMIQGDFGTTFAGSRDIGQQIAARFPVTLSLTAFTMALSVPLSLFLGTYSALHHGKTRSGLIDSATQLVVAVPVFWLAIMLVLVFALNLGLLPTGGYVTPGQGIDAWLRSLTLPVTALTIGTMSVMTRYVKSAVLEVVEEDYVRTAMSKGMTYRRAIYTHGLRNASIPIVTVAVLIVGSLIGGAVVTESVFSMPGLGRLMVDAISARETLVVQSLAFVLLLIVLALNFVLDLLYGVLDPRIRDAAAKQARYKKAA